MSKKKLSEATFDELNTALVSHVNEKEALEHTIHQIEMEIFCRENPKTEKYHIDTYINL